jgi:AraC-like DNA-binding protein
MAGGQVRLEARMSDVSEKWGERVAGRGFAQIPNYLLLLNQFLIEEKRLKPSELLVLLQLVGAWWQKDELPFPSLRTLAARAGISERQAQRSVNQLEELNLIKRVRRHKGKNAMLASNAYDLAPLADFLGEVSKAFPNEYVRKIPKEKLDALDVKLEGKNDGEEPRPVKLKPIVIKKRVINLDG